MKTDNLKFTIFTIYSIQVWGINSNYFLLHFAYEQI